MLYYCQTGVRNYGKKPVRIYTRPYWEFMIFPKGRGCPSLPGESMGESGGNFWIFRPDCAHGWIDPDDRECEVAVFHFAHVPSQLSERMIESPWLSCSVGKNILEEIRDSAREVMGEVNKPGPNSQLHFQLVQIRLSYLFLEHASLPPARTSPEEQIVNAALAWFSSHMDEGVGVREMAEEMGYNVSHMRRLFSQVKDRSPREELLSLKMDRARGLLLQGNGVLDTALACGFSSHSGFTRAFTAYTGYPPRDDQH